MFRARLSLVLLLALPIAACGREATPIPSPDPVVATAKSEAKVVAPTPAPTTEPTPAPAPNAALPGAAPKALPATKNGVLAPGAADKVLAIGSKPMVTLLEPGAEPRSDLSYALTKGSAQKLKMAMDMVMSMKMGGRALPATTIPTMTMLMDMTTAEERAGEWRIDAKLTKTTIEAKGAQQEQIAAAMRPQVEGMKGLGMGYWVSAKGTVRDMKLDVPKTLPPAAQQMLQGMNQSFESMVAPLPAEPVGIGAKWQVITRLASSGADLLQSATYTLKARNGTKVTVDVVLTQVAASGTIKAPGMPADMSAHVKSFTSGGTGTNQVDTKAVAPESGTMTLKTAMDIGVKAAGAAATGGDDTSVDTITIVHLSRP